MKKTKLFENYMLGVDVNYDDIREMLQNYHQVTVVCFENNFSDKNYYLRLLNESWVDKVILIGAKPNRCLGKKLIRTNEIKEKYLKNSQRVFFIVDTDVDEDVLKPLVNLFDIAKKLEITIGSEDIIGVCNKTNDLLEKSLEALLQDGLYKRYSIVYDYICDELNSKFADNSICQFEDNRCIANRKYYDKCKIMGCCYSFKYNGFQFSDIRLCEHQKDQKCNVQCLGCKLFTCDYLKEHGIKFSLNNMPIALAFFDKKQRETLRTTFFTTKEDVLSRVIKGRE